MQVVQRLDAEAIPANHQLPLDLIPYGKREHAAHMNHCLIAISLEQMQQRFRVGPCSIVNAGSLELRLKSRMVEHFSVVNEGISPVLAVHRLLAVIHVDDA